MANLIDYVEKYGDQRFENMRFNEVDNVILSLIPYLDLTHTKINENCHTLEEIGREYLMKNDYKTVRKFGIAMGDTYLLMKALVESERYRHLIVKDYVYNAKRDMQFCAMTIRVTRGLEYIAFEGTDQLISGWREDFELACSFPVPSHIEATKYLNEHVSAFGPNVIIGGHSKGGNLALVGAMYMNRIKLQRIKKIYNNDGPGLRRAEFESKAYQKVLKKYVHIVPHCSVVGILMRNSNYQVVKSSKDNLLGHAAMTWEVVGDHFKRAHRSEKSLELERRIWSWLDKHNDADRKIMLEAIFGTIEGCDIIDTMSLTKLQNIKKLIRSARELDKESKDIVNSFIKEIAFKRK